MLCSYHALCSIICTVLRDRCLVMVVFDCIVIKHIIIFLPWYFIPRVLKLASVDLYVRNGYDGDSETVNVLARQTALKR